jgi:hypothetical protein
VIFVALLHEKLLIKDELVNFLKLLFGETEFAEAPDIHTDWNSVSAFLSSIIVTEQGKQWDPVLRKMGYWQRVVERTTLG